MAFIICYYPPPTTSLSVASQLYSMIHLVILCIKFYNTVNVFGLLLRFIYFVCFEPERERRKQRTNKTNNKNYKNETETNYLINIYGQNLVSENRKRFSKKKQRFLFFACFWISFCSQLSYCKCGRVCNGTELASLFYRISV